MATLSNVFRILSADLVPWLDGASTPGSRPLPAPKPSPPLTFGPKILLANENQFMITPDPIRIV